MKIEFDKLFSKCLDKLLDKEIKIKTLKLIEEIDSAKTIKEIKNVKKLKGYNDYYRIKVSEFRICFELKNNSLIRFVLISHRKDVYKKFQNKF